MRLWIGACNEIPFRSIFYTLGSSQVSPTVKGLSVLIACISACSYPPGLWPWSSLQSKPFQCQPKTSSHGSLTICHTMQTSQWVHQQPSSHPADVSLDFHRCYETGTVHLCKSSPLDHSKTRCRSAEMGCTPRPKTHRLHTRLQ